ncbi:MAG TPA: hypothetical protein VMQ63_03355, partial [Stellaceae bacterium]|nr:hypothetical protein [Stellaceae bacterium]
MAALLSKPFAGIGVADARREQAEGEGQHDDIPHENAPCRACIIAQRLRVLREGVCDGSIGGSIAILTLPVSVPL